MFFSPGDALAAVEKPETIVDWEEPDCPLCGRREWLPLIEAPDSSAGKDGLWFAVVQCQHCGLCFTNPRPSLDSIGQFYPSCYRPHQIRGRRKPWHSRWIGSGRVPYHVRKLLSKPAGGRLLDFGCGGGTFLARMHDLSWEVTGLDVSPLAVQRIRSELGLRALVGSLPHPDLDSCSFEVVTMWHALEHVHDPVAILREARRLLVPGGTLLVAVPNIDSLPFQWFGPAWFGLDLPRHLTHFSPATLEVMLELAGFRLGSIGMVRHSDWLRSSAALLAKQGHGRTARGLLRFKLPSRLCTWYAYFTRRSDCMIALAMR